MEAKNLYSKYMNDKKITLELTMQELQIIAAGLHELRYKDVVGLLMRIDTQIQQQMQQEKPKE